jgi:hypothetical protein
MPGYIMVEDVRTEWCEECRLDALTTFGLFDDTGMIGEFTECVVCSEAD